jgi:hypothetical protein
MVYLFARVMNSDLRMKKSEQAELSHAALLIIPYLLTAQVTNSSSYQSNTKHTVHSVHGMSAFLSFNLLALSVCRIYEFGLKKIHVPFK